jgi:hypothetical protein
MTTKVTPTSAAIAKTRLPYPKIANTIKLPSQDSAYGIGFILSNVFY